MWYDVPGLYIQTGSSISIWGTHAHSLTVKLEERLFITLTLPYHKLNPLCPQFPWLHSRLESVCQIASWKNWHMPDAKTLGFYLIWCLQFLLWKQQTTNVGYMTATLRAWEGGYVFVIVTHKEWGILFNWNLSLTRGSKTLIPIANAWIGGI